MNNQIITADPFSSPKEVKLFAKRIFEGLDVAEATRADYLSRIDLFLQFFKKQKYSLTPHTFLEYKRFLQKRTDYTVSTKNKYLIATKVFLSQYCKLYGLPNITTNVKVFSQSRAHKVEGVNKEEMEKVASTLAALPATPDNLRVKSIICFLALQGLRQIEIVRLDVKDIDFVNHQAQVQGKGRDDKESIDLHPETVKVLKEYIKANKLKDGALFFCKSNNNRNNRLTTRAIRQIAKDLLFSAGIEKTVHGFRHYFTTMLIQTYKGDLLEVAQYTRHKSLQMLQVYNDRIKKKEDLPRYYKTFEGISF